MLGYMDNEEANKKTFDKDGWMRSGDIGYFDQEGFLYVVDRIKELIKVKGLQESKQRNISCLSSNSAGGPGRTGGCTEGPEGGAGCCCDWGGE